MAEVAGKIVLELDLTDKGFTIKMQEASGVVRQFTRNVDTTAKSVRRMERSVTGIMPKLRDLFVTVSMVKSAFHNLYAATFGWQMKLIKTNAEIERMTFLLRGMSTATSDLGKNQEAAQDLAFLFDLAETTPFSLNELTSSFVKFRSVGLEPTDGSLRALSDALASFGGNEIALHRATIAIQQMSGKGVISMEELRQQLGEHVPNAISTMARAVGMSYQELVDRVSKGQVVAKDALQRTFDEWERSVGGASQRMMTTWSGMISILETRWTKFQLKLGDQGFFDTAKRMLGELVNSFDAHAIEYWGTVAGTAMTNFIKYLSATINALTEHRRLIVDVSKTLVTMFLIYKGASIILALRNGFLALAAATRANVAANTALSFSQLQLVNSSNLAAAALGAARAADARFQAGLAMAGGPIGILLTALTAAAAAFVLFSGRAKGAYEDIKKFGSAVDETAQKLAERHMLDLRRKASALAANMNDEVNFSAARRAKMREEYDGLVAEIESGEARLINSRQGLRQRGIDLALADLRSDLAFDILRHQTDYTVAMRDVTAQLEAGLISGEQARAIQLQQATELADAKIEVFRERARVISEAMKTASDDELAQLQAQNNALYEEETAYAAQVEATLDRIRNPTGLVAGVEGSKGGVSKLQTFLNNLGAGIENTSAELAGLNGEVAKFQFLLEAGVFKEDGTALLGDPARLEAVLNQIRELERLKEKLTEVRKAEREGIQAQGQLRMLTERTTAANQALRESIDSGGRLRESSQLAVFRRDVEELVSKLPEAERATEETKNAIRALLTEMEATPSLEFIDQLRDETREIEVGLLSARQAREANYNDAVADTIRQANLHALAGYDRMRAERLLNEHLSALARQHARDMEHPIEALARSWEDASERMKEASGGWMDSLSNSLTDLVTTGKMKFSDFAESVIKDIVRIRIQEAMSAMLMSIFGGGFSMGGLTTQGVTPSDVNTPSMLPFAKGGIMSAYGALPLHAYATGGIAKTPQLAVFGEGRQPEAYVPLPDGRSIPVTMNGGANVQVNVINQSGQQVEAQHSQPRFDGRQMVLDVVLTAASQPGPFRDSMRGAMK